MWSWLTRRLDRKDPGRMLDAVIEMNDRKVRNIDGAIESDGSKPRQSFASGLPFTEQSFTRLGLAEIKRMRDIYPPLMWRMLTSGRYWKPRPAERPVTAPPEFFEELERLARELGASSIGYVSDIPAGQIFRDTAIPHPNAIVFTVEMDRDEIAKAPGFDAFREVGYGYKRLAVVANAVADHMIEAGYAAYPGTALGGLTDYVALAEMAGLGAIGYHGLLISPESGPRLRISSIYTNVSNLPRRENPHLWVRDFCSQCRNCVRSCPAGAIYDEPRDNEWAGKTCIEYGACLDYFSANFGCAVCVKVCPFGNAGYEKVKAGFSAGGELLTIGPRRG